MNPYPPLVEPKKKKEKSFHSFKLLMVRENSFFVCLHVCALFAYPEFVVVDGTVSVDDELIGSERLRLF